MASLTTYAHYADSLVAALRPWTRRDRRDASSWPALEAPEHWFAVEASDGPRVSYAIEARRGVWAGRLVGRLTLRDIRNDDSATVGIYLRPDATGQGYGGEALRLFSIVAYNWHGVRILRVDAATDNQRAIAVYQRCGYAQVDLVQRAGAAYAVMERQCIH